LIFNDYIFNATNSILLKLNDDRTIVNLTINDGRFEEYDAKMENHKLSVYSSPSIAQFLYNNLVTLLNWILLLGATILLLIMCRKYLLYYSKTLLNSKYNVNFPYVHIKTNSMELKGKVRDIFDENLIILENHENYSYLIIKSVKWNSIEYLEIDRFRP
jgi:hypothetical protein